jgi:hypothetical protein
MPATKPLREFTSAERQEWRRTGTLPAASAAPAPAEPVAQVAETSASPAPASEPADEPLKPKAKARFDTILAERRAATERAERAERRNAELEAKLTPAPVAPAAPAASAPAPTGLIEPDPADTTKYPWGAADPKFIKDQAAFAVQTVLAAERANDAAARQRAEVAASWGQTISTFEQRCQSVKADPSMPDFQTVALDADVPIPRGSTIDMAILQGEHGPRVLYHLSKNRAEIDRILKMPLVWSQMEALVRLGDKLAPAPPASPVNDDLPEPAIVLPTRGAPGDPVAGAIKRRDFRSYKDSANAAEMASAGRGSRRT